MTEFGFREKTEGNKCPSLIFANANMTQEKNK